MKITKKHIRIAGYISISTAFCALGMFIVSSVFGVQHYDLQSDNRIVPALNAELADAVKNLPCGVRVMPDITAQNLQKQFSWIKSVSLQRLPTKTMKVIVAAENPHVKVNDAVISDQLRVFPASTFLAACLTPLSSLSVTFPGADIPDAFIPHAETFTAERFAPYTITWIDEYTARLIDNSEPQFTILFNVYSIPDAAMFAHCASIKQLLHERGSFAGRAKGSRWVTDIRFERQVIVFSEKGGIAHG